MLDALHRRACAQQVVQRSSTGIVNNFSLLRRSWERGKGMDRENGRNFDLIISLRSPRCVPLHFVYQCGNVQPLYTWVRRWRFARSSSSAGWYSLIRTTWSPLHQGEFQALSGVLRRRSLATWGTTRCGVRSNVTVQFGWEWTINKRCRTMECNFVVR